ncbi:hypothetical protein N7474_011220 [Penicillium riverlandense]|uniref:uncharacterized protein n=1 Tax=Penicillium riverlandense TaxID=1903569 RepID=UPI0025477D61|nr:uncharacterized protein N7474_011220 [Penicillium riverlandense]KAJ5805333.1 hypothetical protein N7474_011220 [Penicillium riverlandense]
MATTSITKLDYKVGSDVASIGSSASTLCPTITDESFTSSRKLYIDAHGIRAFRLPLPDSQTEIPVYDEDGVVAYSSTRSKRWSGSSVLSSSKHGNLIHTDYFFGPNRDPVLRLLQSTDVRPEELQVSGKWTSRSTRFTMPNGTRFEWSYAKEKREGKHVNLIILRMVDTVSQAKEPTNGRIVAKLVRGEDTRTPGTSRCRAGNGGELQIDENALTSAQLKEAVVVATSLIMMKREIDRRRALQFAMIGGGGAS